MVGQALGRYRLLERVGAGGMGVVYRARDEHLDREVAVKVLAEGKVDDDRARRRFRKEAAALSKLNHPNIATIHDFETVGDRDLLVMEYIPGETLREHLARGTLSEAEFLNLATQIVEGLAAAHAEGVLHRDLKPGNIRMTPDGRVKLLDFGLASVLATDERTRTDTESEFRGGGTPPYLPPEQLAGKPLDQRADVYAAGATLYELAVGRPLFPDARGLDLIEAVLRREPASPRSVNPDVSPAVEAILLKALDKSPERRYQSARELLVDLRRCAGPSRPAPLPKGRVLRARRVVWAAVLAASLGVAAWLASRWTPGPPVFPERGWVLLGDFTNDAGEPNLERALHEGLTIALQQSQFINVFAGDRTVDALQRMQRPASTRIDEAIGLELCRRERVQILLAGGISRSGTAIQILVKALDAGSGRLLFAESVHYTRREDFYDRLDSLARRVRRNLGESLARINKTSIPLAQVTTPSYEALQQYSQAVDARAHGDLEKVEVSLGAALTLDPDFAMAHVRLGDYYAGVRGNTATALDHFKRAYDLRDRVTERERHFISATYFNALEQYDRSRDSLAMLTRLYPDDPEFRYELAVAHYSLGDLERAIAEIRASLARDPHSTRAHGSLVLFLARNNAGDEAVAAYDAAVSGGADSPYLLWGLGLALWGGGELDRARDAFGRLQQYEGFYRSLGRLHLARMDLYEARLDRAIAGFEEGIRESRAQATGGMERLHRYLLARTHQAAGRPSLARREAAALLADSTLKADDLRRAGTLLVWAGDTSGARRVLERLGALRQSAPTLYGDFCFFALSGEIMLAENRLREALDAFERAAAATPSYAAWTGLARTHERRQAVDLAIAQWERVLGAKGEILQDGFPLDVGLAHLSLARLSRRRGQAARACEHYAIVEGIWRDGTWSSIDKDAAALRAELSCRAGNARGAPK